MSRGKLRANAPGCDLTAESKTSSATAPCKFGKSHSYEKSREDVGVIYFTHQFFFIIRFTCKEHLTPEQHIGSNEHLKMEVSLPENCEDNSAHQY